MRRQLGDEPLGKGPARLAVVLIGGGGLTSRHRLTIDARDDRSGRSTVEGSVGALAVAARPCLSRGLVFRPNIAALDPHFLVDKTLEQRDILEPAPMILAEEIAGDHAASRLISLRADEHGPA